MSVPPEYVPGSFWFYAPNKGAAIFFTAAFAAVSVAHLWQTIHYKCFRLTNLFVLAGLLFTAGFALRVNGAFGNHDKLIPFILSVVFIAVAPPLLALSNYHILGRVLYYVPYNSPVHPGKVLIVFGTLTLVIETVNGVGAAFVSNPQGRLRSAGGAVMLVSLSMQILIELCFLALAAVFHARCRGRNGGVAARARGFCTPMKTLYASTTLILVRTAFRVAEQSADSAGGANHRGPSARPDLLRYEAYFLAFECAVMLLNLATWSVLHPRRFLPADIGTYLAPDGAGEVTSPAFWQGGHGGLTAWAMEMLRIPTRGRARGKSDGSMLLPDEGLRRG